MPYETDMLVHRLQLEVFKMYNLRKRNLSEVENLKMIYIHDKVEELLLELNDGAFEVQVEAQ